MMKRRRRRAPASTLRSSLGRRMREKEKWGSDAFDDEPDRAAGLDLLTNFVQRVHRYLLIKMIVAVAVVLLTALLYRGGYAGGKAAVEALQFVVFWDMKTEQLVERVIPAFRAVWDQSNMLREITDQTLNQRNLPLEGRLIVDYGLHTDLDSGREQMHYGIDLAAAEGSPIYAVLNGVVIEVTDRGGVITVILTHDHGWQTLYRGIKEPLVKEGEEVRAGGRLGLLGASQDEEEPHLHFEIRHHGRPVAPLADWLEQFRKPAI